MALLIQLFLNDWIEEIAAHVINLNCGSRIVGGVFTGAPKPSFRRGALIDHGAHFEHAYD